MSVLERLLGALAHRPSVPSSKLLRSSKSEGALGAFCWGVIVGWPAACKSVVFSTPANRSLNISLYEHADLLNLSLAAGLVFLQMSWGACLPTCNLRVIYIHKIVGGVQVRGRNCIVL